MSRVFIAICLALCLLVGCGAPAETEAPVEENYAVEVDGVEEKQFDVIEEEPEPVEEAFSFNETVFLCEDENMCISLSKVDNGIIWVEVTNKTDIDLTAGVSYLDFNSTTYYNDIMVEDFYANKTREYEITLVDDNYEYLDYTFNGGTLSGQFYYYVSDGESDLQGKLKFKDVQVGETGEPIEEALEADKGIFLGEDKNVAIYLAAVENGLVTVNIENKTQADMYCGVDYADIDGETYYDEMTVTTCFAEHTKRYTITHFYDSDFNDVEYTVSSTFGGQFSYYSDDDEGLRGKIKFEAVSIEP